MRSGTFEDNTGGAGANFARRAFLAALAGAAARAQPSEPRLLARTAPAANRPPAEERPVPHLRIDTTLVQIPVSVFSPLNQPVTGLERENFRLLEDAVEQEIAACGVFDAPLSVGLVFDASRSMSTRIAKAREAAARFFEQANPEDEFFLVQFNDRPRLTIPFTRDVDEIQNRLLFTPPRGRTALLDAVYHALQLLKQGRNPRKALLILSDGEDNSSRYSESDVRRFVREADAQMFAMGVGLESYGRMLLSELTEITGGRLYAVSGVEHLPEIAAKIAAALREQYLLAYTPRNAARDGKYRRVKVEVKKMRNIPDLRVYHRTGYYAGGG